MEQEPKIEKINKEEVLKSLDNVISFIHTTAEKDPELILGLDMLNDLQLLKDEIQRS